MNFELEIYNEKPMVSSVKIASIFGRDHSHVMRSINNVIKKSKDIVVLDGIVENYFIDSLNRRQSMMLLDETASLIVIPFIGGEKSLEGQIALVDSYMKYREMALKNKKPKIGIELIQDPIVFPKVICIRLDSNAVVGICTARTKGEYTLFKESALKIRDRMKGTDYTDKKMIKKYKNEVYLDAIGVKYKNNILKKYTID